MQAEKFFARLWENYLAIAPSAGRIRRLIERHFGEVKNDHVAFRTFDQSPLALFDLEAVFLAMGYTRDRAYDFPDKHLRAYGYLPSQQSLPLVFLSELTTSRLPAPCQTWVQRAIESSGLPGSLDEALLSGRPWELPTWDEYQMLDRESPYAAWLSVWGLCANHFTVAVHALSPPTTLEQVVAALKSDGYDMNEVGGLIKGSRAQLLEQSSTMAELRPVTFADGKTRTIPSCYYEFAHRHHRPSGELYLGFVAASANDIFESTTAQKGEQPQNS